MIAAPSRRLVVPARLILEDGTVFDGYGFGACHEPRSIFGEIVFNTAMTGYQEALTDPSYAGQILTMTVPEVGNYGICRGDEESDRPQVAGFAVRELARLRSNHRSYTDLDRWLAEGGVLGVEDIDTRALVRRLRTDGSMRGAVSCDPAVSSRELLELVRASPEMTGRNLAAEVSAPRVRSARDRSAAGSDGPRVLALDCGAKRNIYRHLTARGCTVDAVPWDRSADEIMAMRPDGLLVSNGPGDPAAVASTIATLRRIVAMPAPIPMFGICLGHQLLALALGARTFKLKFGHRGANQPVRCLLTGRVEISSQNHGFCVDADSLEAVDCDITHLHLNDGTLAGFRHRHKPIFSVQYHPEASPGPHDSSYLFDCFLDMMRTGRPLSADTAGRIQAAHGVAGVSDWPGSPALARTGEGDPNEPADH